MALLISFGKCNNNHSQTIGFHTISGQYITGLEYPIVLGSILTFRAWCLMICCDNDIECAPPGTSFYHVPLKRDPEFAQRGKIWPLGGHPTLALVLLRNIRLVDPPLDDPNTHVCSHYFAANDYVKSVLEGLGPAEPMLKQTAVQTIFSFIKPVQQRKMSKARAAKSQHQSLVDDLLGPSSASSSH